MIFFLTRPENVLFQKMAQNQPKMSLLSNIGLEIWDLRNAEIYICIIVIGVIENFPEALKIKIGPCPLGFNFALLHKVRF